MLKESAHIHDECCHASKRISWSAILVGALVGIGLSFLLNIFGVAIGLSAYTVSDTGAATLAIGGVIGLIISLIVAMFVSGYAAGFLGRHYCPERNLGILYGFTTWTVALVLSAVLMGHLGTYATWYTHVVVGSPVTMTNEEDEQPVSLKTKRMKETVKENGEEAKAKQVGTSVNVTPEGLASGAFILFGLFFIGAISSCWGASCGMSCCRKEKVVQ